MYGHYRLAAIILAILGALVPVHAVLGDLYDVLAGDSRDQVDALFLAYPGEADPDLDAARSRSLIEQRAVFGGQHVAPNLLRQTRGMSAVQVRSSDMASATHRWTLHVQTAKQHRMFKVYESQWGEVFVQDLAPQTDVAREFVYKVHRQRFIDLIWNGLPWHGGPRPSPDPDPALPKPGTVGELPKPYEFGGVLFNEETLRTDLMFGASSIAGTKRELKNETFLIRLPKDYRPSTPAGLLVWIDADKTGAPREQLFEALDAFNIVAVGAVNTGNDRPLSDRVQLAMDAMESARAHVPIDSDRVYIGGISGGGRVASMLGIAFPKTFHACLCVVGLNSFHNVARSDGKHVQRATGTPTPRVLAMLKGYQIAAVTGPNDFNQSEITARSLALHRNQIDCKVFDLPELGHQMPKPADLKEVIDWFDKERRASADRVQQSADAYWTAALAKLPATGPLNDSQRAELLKNNVPAVVSPGLWKALGRAYPDKFFLDDPPGGKN